VDDVNEFRDLLELEEFKKVLQKPQVNPFAQMAEQYRERKKKK
jgi:hypothetical protein